MLPLSLYRSLTHPMPIAPAQPARTNPLVCHLPALVDTLRSHCAPPYSLLPPVLLPAFVSSAVSSRRVCCVSPPSSSREPLLRINTRPTAAHLNGNWLRGRGVGAWKRLTLPRTQLIWTASSHLHLSSPPITTKASPTHASGHHSHLH
ncbi:hypothetical protein E2C01_065755 [Portunus trituberculatus]|uniref:Uncharacterized protein n=1 Tax=Portunus trituberculatus TaxID=210409 RepID=A0A5B7HQG6_PORTR|nr:hypothetical protein [Portunus trituberculatus]